MKIIKKGKELARAKQITCKYCDSELEYSRKDVNPDQRDGDYVICPVCKHWLNI